MAGGATFAGLELAVELLGGIAGARQAGDVVGMVEAVAEPAPHDAGVVGLGPQPGGDLPVGVARRQGAEQEGEAIRDA